MRSTISPRSIFGSAAILMLASIALTSCSEDPETKEPVEFLITPQSREISFMAAYPESCTYEISTNAQSWKAESDAEWLTIDTSSSRLIISARPNLSFEERSGATVTITADDSTMFQITATQDPLQVYTGGSENSVAAYWFNNEKHIMTETGGNTINGIHVTKDGTVHLTGTTYGAKSLGFYWSNSSGTVYTNRVDEGSGSAFDVFVDEENSNIYFTTHEGWTNSDGTQTYQAALWTNMEPKDEPESMSAGDIYVEDGKVYVMYDGYYKINDEKTELEIIGDGNYPSCMTVHNGDVYVGGYYLNTDRFCPAYWINGKAYPIPTDINSQIYSISVDSNGDVYLGGSEGPGLDRRAAYWKNGEMTAITEYANACIGEMFVLDGETIIIYFEQNEAGNTTVKCSMNGEIIDISDGYAPSYAQCGFII